MTKKPTKSQIELAKTSVINKVIGACQTINAVAVVNDDTGLVYIWEFGPDRGTEFIHTCIELELGHAVWFPVAGHAKRIDTPKQQNTRKPKAKPTTKKRGAKK
jgi:hypothetical protein